MEEGGRGRGVMDQDPSRSNSRREGELPELSPQLSRGVSRRQAVASPSFPPPLLFSDCKWTVAATAGWGGKSTRNPYRV